MTNSRTWALALVATAALAACGGGSDAPTPSVASAVTIAGTAAKGAALAGAAVSIKCAAGTGTATTASDGTYTVTITGGNLPCALKVVGTEGSVFHSVVAGTGDSGNFAANITPLTEMMVAQIGGAAPDSFFDGFGSNSAVTPAALTAAVDYVRVALAGSADLTGFNPATDALVVGNPLDQKIDAVMAAFVAAGVTLQEVAATIVSNPTSPTVVSAPLAPQATDCASLKSGKYRMINPYETDPQWKAHVLTVDAAALTAIDQDGTNLAITSNGGCQFTIAETDYTNTVMVSSGGVLVVYSQSTTVATDRSVTIGLPEQTLPVSELAGTWNTADWDPNSSQATTPGYVAHTGEVTFDANGAFVSGQECVGLAPCEAETGPFATFTSNATSGGFDIAEGGTNAGRAFVYKTLAGKSVLVLVFNDGYFAVATRKQALGALPAVGSVSDFREFNLNGNGTLTTLLDQSVSVTAVDAVANTATRLRASDSRVDTIAYDSPRNGLRYRTANTCTINGVASNCAATVQFPLQGMGITLALSVGVTTPASAFYNVSIGKPAAAN
jgi:hypothetical protein